MYTVAMSAALSAIMLPVAFAQTGGAPVTVTMQPCTSGYQPPVAMAPGRWITMEDYPDSAIRAGEQGKAYVTITAGANGRPIDVEVTSGSVGPILKQKTIDLVMRRGRFKPALQDCKPVQGEYETSFTWVMPSD